MWASSQQGVSCLLLTLTVSCCLGLRLSGRVMVNFSFPLSSSESAFCPGRNSSGMMPIPTSWFLCNFSKLSAMTARTPCVSTDQRESGTQAREWWCNRKWIHQSASPGCMNTEVYLINVSISLIDKNIYCLYIFQNYSIRSLYKNWINLNPSSVLISERE